ncbi:hypothetical protein JXO59_14995 [candidate division KSB1 bacterium]|nr:hypothetical protein [candidate division KSB1 bacterium]
MSVLNQIAHFQGRRDDVPNQNLARQLAAQKDRAGIAEIAGHLWDRDKNIQSDCAKVLYEIGYIDPGLIADYGPDFLKLIQSKNNRLVWGGMIALSTIAALAAEQLYPHVDAIERIIQGGSVITVDAGIRTLAGIAGGNETRTGRILPFLLQHLAGCRPKDVAQHAEKIVSAVDADNKHKFIEVLEKRRVDLTDSQWQRVKRVLKQV